jgi:hypothetical protein
VVNDSSTTFAWSVRNRYTSDKSELGHRLSRDVSGRAVTEHENQEHEENAGHASVHLQWTMALVTHVAEQSNHREHSSRPGEGHAIKIDE